MAKEAGTMQRFLLQASASTVDIRYLGKKRAASGNRERFDKGIAVTENDVVVVNLEGLVIDELLSKDGIRKRKKSKRLRHREGTLNLTLNGQASVLAWSTDAAGKLREEQRFSDQLLFFGTQPGLLDIEARIIETDRKAVDKLGKTQGFLGVASKFGSLVPGASLASAGLNFAGALTEAFRKRVDDDLELAFYGSVGDFGDPDRVPLREGTYEIARTSEDGVTSEVAIRFTVHRFGKKDAAGAASTGVMIALDSVEYEVAEELTRVPAPAAPEGAPKPPPKPPKLPRWNLVFESSFGAGKAVSKVSFEGKVIDRGVTLPLVLALRHKILYTGAWEPGVPFHLSLALVTNKDSGLLKDLVEQTAEVVKVAGELDDDAQDRLDKATKAVQSARSFVLEFLPDKVEIGSLSGFIGDDQEAKVPQLGNFRTVSPGEAWQKIPTIRMVSEGGAARIGLSIRRLS